MKTQIANPARHCPKCNSEENQVNAGYNRSGTQRCICNYCKYKYTLNGKIQEYPEEVKQQAIKTYFSGVSGRGVGKLMGFSKANVYNWLKKPSEMWISEATANEIFEMDEMYHFVERKANSETRENIYVTTLVSREPRQIVGFSVAFDKSPERLQGIVDNSPEAESYATDGYLAYIDLAYPGKHIRNVGDKGDTFTVEGINADLRHYIPVLARRSRCFCRSLETLEAVLWVFIEAYNKFGEAKQRYRQRRQALGRSCKEVPFGVVDFL